MMHSATYHILHPCLHLPHISRLTNGSPISSLSKLMLACLLSLCPSYFEFLSPACPLWKNVSSGLCPFFYLVVCFLILSGMSSLYILDINLLLDILFANMFFHSVGCLFILLIISFTVQKLFHLI